MGKYREKKVCVFFYFVVEEKKVFDRIEKKKREVYFRIWYFFLKYNYNVWLCFIWYLFFIRGCMFNVLIID